MSVNKTIYVIYGVKTTFDFVESLDLEYDAAEEITVTDNMGGDYAYIGVTLGFSDLEDGEGIDFITIAPENIGRHRTSFFNKYADLILAHPKLQEAVFGMWELHIFTHYS